MNDWLDAETRAERALQLSESQKWREALNELEAALAINPHDSFWHAQRGQILDQLDQFAEAVEAYRQSLDLEPDNLEINTALGIDLIRIGQYEQAVHHFERLSKSYPDYEPAYCHRIAAYTRMGQHDRAENMFYLAQQLNENCPSCFHHIAESLACRGFYAKALYCWQRTLEIEPDFPCVRQRIAEIHRQEHNYEKAREFLLAALRRDPGNTDILAELGDLLIEVGDFEGAEAEFRQVLALNPTAVRAHVVLGLMASRKDDPDTAIRYFRTALALDQHFPGLRAQIGEAELRRGNHREALHHLSLALEDDGNDRLALMAMGNCLLEIFRPTEAQTYYERLIELEPISAGAGAHHNLAVCRFLQNDLEGGIRHCLTALEIEPENIMAIHKLTLAYLHLGRWGQAREIIRRGLRIDPNHLGLNKLAKQFWLLRIKQTIRKLLCLSR